MKDRVDWVFGFGPPPRRRSRWRVVAIALAALAVAWFLLSTVVQALERRAVASQLERIASEDEDVRRVALSEIRWIGPGAAPALAEALRNGDRSTRRAAAAAAASVLYECVGKLTEQNCFTGIVFGQGSALAVLEHVKPALVEALGDADEAIRLEAARALGLIADLRQYKAAGMPVHVEDLRRAGLATPDKLAAFVLQAALRKERDPKAVKELIELLGKFQPSVHLEGASALIRFLDDEDEPVKLAALSALAGSIAEAGVSDETKEPIRRVVPLLVSGGKRDRDATVRALVQLVKVQAAGPEAVPPLIEALRPPNWLTWDAALALAALARDREAASVLVKHLPTLIEALKGPVRYPDARGNVVAVVRQLGPAAAAAVPGLVKLLDDPGETEKRFAAEALGAMGEAARPAIPALVKLLDGLSAEAALAAPASVEAAHVEAARAAAATLGAIGPAAVEALPALRKAASESADQETRSRCRTALSQIEE